MRVYQTAEEQNVLNICHSRHIHRLDATSQVIVFLLPSGFCLTESGFNSGSRVTPTSNFVLVIFKPLQHSILEKKGNVGELDGIFSSVVDTHLVLVLQPVADIYFRCFRESLKVPLADGALKRAGFVGTSVVTIVTSPWHPEKCSAAPELQNVV